MKWILTRQAMGHVSPKKIIWHQERVIFQISLGIQDQRTAMSICAGCPLAPRALDDTLLRLVKSPLRRVPRTLLKKKAKRRRKQETTVINEKAGSNGPPSLCSAIGSERRRHRHRTLPTGF
jgi:hypothetical protein